MSITTKKGDLGRTKLLTGQEVSKNHDRVEAYGTLDELMSALGLARSLLPDCELANEVRNLQNDLISVTAELACEGESALVKPQTEVDIEKMEKRIAKWESELELPQQFMVSGDGHPASAALDLARTISRRLERRMIPLFEEELVSKTLFIYVNRLSDYLFLLSHASKELRND